MKKATLIFTFILLFLAAGYGQNSKNVFQKYRDKICLVEYYKNIASQSKIGSYIKVKQKRIGLVVSADGLVIVNSDIYPISLDILSNDGGSYASGEPTDFKIKLHDGTELNGEFVGKDDVAQMAFVQITDELPAALPFVDFQPTEHIEVGQPVFLLELLGENYDYEPLFTAYTINAVVKSPRRKFLIKNDVNALSVGGLLVTSSGEPVGITLRSGQNYSFGGDFDDFRQDFTEIAPTESFKDLIKDPPVFQKATHQGKAWFGISMQALTPGLKAYWKVPAEGGVIIDRIYPNSAAEKAGLATKDVILSFNGEKLNIDKEENLKQFRQMITNQKPDNEIELEIFRNGKIKKKKIKLGAAPRSIDLAEKYQQSELGIEVRELTVDILYDYNMPLNTEGVYVFQVDRASPAGLGNLGVGSIITEINGQPVKGLADFEKKISEIQEKGPSKMMLKVQYRRESGFVFVDSQ